MSQKIKIMIVDGFQVLRECLTLALSEQDNITVVEHTADPAEALDKARLSSPDVILVGMDMPQKIALDLTYRLSLQRPDSRVIVLGLPETEQVVLKFIEAGASGYTFKEGSLQDLVKAIQVVHKGGAVCSPRIAYTMFSRVAELAQAQSEQNQSEAAALTLREVEILQLIAEGLGNKQIAERLFISLYTVKNHVHNILEKFQVRHRADAVHYAFTKGILKARSSAVGT